MKTLRPIPMLALSALSLFLLDCNTDKTGNSEAKSSEYGTPVGERQIGLEEVIARHMVGEAMLAAHVVELAERLGMPADSINAILREVAENSAIDEFWITDSHGHAYLTNTGVNFTFSSDSTTEPQAAAFWPLITGNASVVIQKARVREIDNQVFKYVGVAGVDKPRIVQVGVSGKHLVEDRQTDAVLIGQ